MIEYLRNIFGNCVYFYNKNIPYSVYGILDFEYIRNLKLNTVLDNDIDIKPDITKYITIEFDFKTQFIYIDYDIYDYLYNTYFREVDNIRGFFNDGLLPLPDFDKISNDKVSNNKMKDIRVGYITKNKNTILFHEDTVILN